MKQKSNSIAILCLLFLMALHSACTLPQDNPGHGNHADAETGYICPMRCEGEKTYVKPGNCPVCKMKLEAAEEKLLQTESPARLVLSRQSTTRLQAKGNEDGIQAEGVIVPSADRMLSVSARFGGRVEKLYVKFNLQYVREGEKIMDIYSPGLRTYQEQHLYLLSSGADPAFIGRSREKLRLLGISGQQIERLEKYKSADANISVYSPASGYVFFGTDVSEVTGAEAPASPMGGMGMLQEVGNDKTYAGLGQLREGMYVNEGQLLFNLNALDLVWAMVSVPARNLQQVRLNQSVNIQSESSPKLEINGKVSLIEQSFDDAGQQFVKVRVVLNNLNQSLKINELISARILTGSDEAMQVPSSAVLRTGLNAYVWVKTGQTKTGTGVFEARRVLVSADDNGYTTIRSGLAPEEDIALQAGLLTDNETIIHER